MGTGPRAALQRLADAAQDGRLDAVCERHRVRVLTVFGSAVRGEPAPRDLDVAARFESTGQGDLLALLDDFAVPTGRGDLDVLVLDRAGPVAGERALPSST